jgi:hypothetical protein
MQAQRGHSQQLPERTIQDPRQSPWRLSFLENVYDMDFLPKCVCGVFGLASLIYRETPKNAKNKNKTGGLSNQPVTGLSDRE